MKLPGGRRLLAPGQGWFPKFTHGAYRKGHMALIVSSGLGGPRIGILPEISLVRLTRPDTSIQDGGKSSETLGRTVSSQENQMMEDFNSRFRLTIGYMNRILPAA